MSKSSERLRAKNKSNRKTTPLGLEQLETRLMNTLGGLEQNLQLLLSPELIGSTQLVSTPVLTSTTTPPTVKTQPRLARGTEVRGQTTVVSVLGADDQGEANLRYIWQATSTPTNATVSFAANGTNEAKRNTLTFNKAGAYTLLVTIQDGSGLSTTSTLQFNVVQTLTSMRMATTAENINDPSHVQTVAGKALQVRVKGYDQFGDSISIDPTVTWSRISGPSGGTIVSSSADGVSTLTFNRSGDYQLRAKSGAVTADVLVNVVQTLTSIGVRNAENRILTQSNPLTITLSSQRWTAIGMDQFGGTMAQQPTIQWSTTSAPIGSSASIQLEGNTAAVSINMIGAYSFRAQVGSIAFNISLNVNAVLTQLTLLKPDGSTVDSNVAIQNTGTSQRLAVRGFDQFGNAMTSLPALTWSTTQVPARGTATGTLSSGIATISFTRAGVYSLKVKGGNANTSFQINVAQTLTSIVSVDASNRPLITSSPLSVERTDQTVKAVGLDQFEQRMVSQPTFSWTTASAPSNGSASVVARENGTNITFNRAGSFTVRVTSSGLTRNLAFNVRQTLTRIELTPDSSSVLSGSTQQYVVQGIDQFQQPMSTMPALVWSSTGGTVSSTGLLAAGEKAGEFAVSVKAGSISAKISVTITTANPPSTLGDTDLQTLIASLYADNAITRSEMIQILRSAGNDGTVSQSELTDLRALVNSSTGFKMPSFVRELARDVVNDNRANLTYKGQSAGNLAAGSQAALLNKLIDKWFLGADEPVISGSGLTYQTSTGNLFNGAPSRADAKQGYLGDCYFIASVTSIADASADAVRNMFIDNGDGTFTVRFFASAADYVTVNRRLPAYSNGTLGYSGLGQLISNASTTLWVALAEKAYAQWNETGNEGRNGTNTYSGIEGGWMSNVNRQVLGFNSSNYAFSSTPKETLVSALGSGRAVTLGTNSNASSGLYGGHAYLVTGYDASTDRFSAYNPWGTSHPGPLSWDQLKANCSMFTVTDSAGTSPISSLSVRSSTTDTLLGNWTTVVSGPSTFDASNHGTRISEVHEFSDPMATIESLALDVDAVASEWITLDDSKASEPELSALESNELTALNALAVDLAMSMDNLESILG